LSALIFLVLIAGSAWIIGGGACALSTSITCLLCWLAGTGPVSLWFPKTIRYRLFHPLSVVVGFMVITFLISIAKAAGLSIGWRLCAAVLGAGFGGILWLRSDNFRNSRKSVPIRTVWLTALLALVVLAATLPVFSKVGVSTAFGKAYRAYFNGDYLKHVALTREFSKPGIPPQNPYFSGETLHYYWFIYPVVNLIADFPGAEPGPEKAFLACTSAVNILFITMLSACLPVPSRSRILLGLIILFSCFAVSYEGSTLMVRIFSEGKMFPEELGHYNIDGYSRWLWGHPQIDGLHRTFLYTPQHLMSLCFILAGIQLAMYRKQTRYLVLESILAGAAVGLSAFIGLIGAAAFVIRLSGQKLKRIAAGVVPLVCWAAVFWFFRVIQTGGESLTWNLSPDLRRIGLILLCNLGMLILLGVPGLIYAFRKQLPHAGPFLSMAMVSLFMFCFIQLQGNPSDIGLKSALCLTPCLIFGVAVIAHQIPRTTAVLLIVSAIAALPTALFDLWNTQDLSTPRYISFVPDNEVKACRFIRSNTPETWIVQTGPDREPRGYFSLIPTFAGRRTAFGDPMHSRIFQVPGNRHKSRRISIEGLFNPNRNRSVLRDTELLGIDAIFIGRPERASYPDCERNYRNLALVYDESSVRIYKTEPALKVISQTPESLNVTSYESLDVRHLLYVPATQKENIFPGDEGWIALEPGKSARINKKEDYILVAIPRQSDLGVPNHFTVKKNSSGNLYRSDHTMLPPGNYRLDAVNMAGSSQAIPSLCSIRHYPDNSVLASATFAKHPENGQQALNMTFVIEQWTPVSIEISLDDSSELSPFDLFLTMVSEPGEWISI
jgi:hypothetical protein